RFAVVRDEARAVLDHVHDALDLFPGLALVGRSVELALRGANVEVARGQDGDRASVAGPPVVPPLAVVHPRAALRRASDREAVVVVDGGEGVSLDGDFRVATRDHGGEAAVM